MDTARTATTEPNNLVNLEQESLTLRGELVIEIKDQASYDFAVEKRTAAVNWLKTASEFFDPSIADAHALHKKLLAQKKSVCEPVEAQLKAVNAAFIRFDEEQEKLRLAEQFRLEEEARKQAEEDRINEAAAMESQGVDDETVNAILDAPVVHYAPRVAAPTYAKSKAVNMRDNWSGVCDDLFKLVQAVAKDKTKIGLLQINQPALNKMAQALKETMVIPGCRAVNNKVAASGRG